MHLLKVGRLVPAVVVSVVLLSLLVACGGGDSTSSSSKSSSPSASATGASGCQEAADLQASLKSLDDVDVRKDGVKGLTGAVADVATSLDAAVGAASAKLQPHVEGVKTAFTALQASISGLDVDNLRQKAPAIRAALTQLRTSATDLASAVSQECPSS